MKHTKGEWEVRQNKPNEDPEKNGREIFVGVSGKPAIALMYDDNTLVKDKQEALANARLMAAAPELLGALKAALFIFGRGYEPKEGAEETVGGRLYLQMELAIKKATHE